MAKKRNLSARNRRGDKPKVVINKPSISTIKAPPGFKTIRFHQALLEFGDPVLAWWADDGKPHDEDLHLIMHLWNYCLSLKRDDVEAIPRDKLVDLLMLFLKENRDYAEKFLDMLAERKEHFLPDEIQPENSSFMFLRNDEPIMLSAFDPTTLNLCEEPYVPSANNQELLEAMDLFEDKGRKEVLWDFDDAYESERDDIIDTSRKQFEDWLNDRGVSESAARISALAGFFIIYVYFNEEVSLARVDKYVIERGFRDFIERDTEIPPDIMTMYPASVMLFYRFLKDIDYIGKIDTILVWMKKAEKGFIKELNRYYSVR